MFFLTQHATVIHKVLLMKAAMSLVFVIASQGSLESNVMRVPKTSIT